jgi:hypothetical protein
MSEPVTPNTVEALRELLLALYVSGSLLPDAADDVPPEEAARLLDTVMAAAEGRPFTPLGLPFPRSA